MKYVLSKQNSRCGEEGIGFTYIQSWPEDTTRPVRLPALLPPRWETACEVTATNTGDGFQMATAQVLHVKTPHQRKYLLLLLHAAFLLSHFPAVIAKAPAATEPMCTSSLSSPALTSSVGALGTAGLLRRSFQGSFAGVRAIRVHGGLLQALQVRVYPVEVHGRSAASHHHHLLFLLIFLPPEL